MGNHVNVIQQLYVAYYNRPGDPAGLAYWNSVVDAQGGDTSAVAAAFASSAEYTAAYGGKDNRTVVNTVYRNLFGRDGEAAGVDYWADLLDTRKITVDGVVTAIAGGAQGSDLTAYQNKVKFATGFTEALNLHPESAAYNGDDALAHAKMLTSAVTSDATLTTALDNLDAKTAAFVAASKAPIVFTLSASADTGVAFQGGGGNDNFNATAATFSAGDSIHGGGGVNTLTVVDEGAALASSAPAATVANIQHLSLSTKGGVGGAAAYDVSGFTGLEQVSIVAAGAVNLKLGATGREVSVHGNTGAAILSGDALTTVGLSGTSQAATINNGTVDHELNLRISEVGGAATVTDANAKTVKLQVSAGAAGAGSNINLAAAKATALNVDNAAGFTLTTTALAADDKLASLSVKGAGSFSADLAGIATLATVDASLSTGSNDLKVASIAGLAVKGGSGADKVQLTGALSANAVVELGAGNDRYELSHAALNGAKVDGGAGTDTVVMNDAALLPATSSVVYSGFETLDFSSGKGLYDLDRVGSVTTLHTHERLRADVEFSNGRADSTLEFVGQDIPLDLTGKPSEQFVVGANIKFALKDSSGTNDKFTISFTANDGRAEGRINGMVQANDIEANGIETIVIHSTANKLEPENPATATREGAFVHEYVNSITNLRAEGAKTVQVTGDASFDLNRLYSNSFTTFDATGSTGDMTFDGLVRAASAAKTPLNYLGSQGKDYYIATETGVTFQGNGGKDTVLLYRYEQVKDVIKFTKASDSQLIWASGQNKEVANYDQIFDFQSGTDKIDLSGLKLAAGANREGFAKITLASNTHHILESTLKDGVGVFNDNGVQRSIAFAMYGVDDGWMLVDANGDGNYTSGSDMIFSMYGNNQIPVMSDFIF